MTFTPSTSPLVGETLTYLPSGTSPYSYEARGGLIMASGDTVRVLSAWKRDYLPHGGAPLLYVYCPARGTHTHVVATDLVALA